jgi:predicted 2-oxoglutarate/Fe(II)-dependent dioxygenase YbiX
MKNNLKDYIGHFKNIVPYNLCDDIINENKNCNWTQHTFIDPITGKSITRSGSKELDITYNTENSENVKKLMEIIWNTIYKYVKKYGNKHFTNWSGHTFVRFNKYEKNKKMAPHCDHIHSIFDGKIKGIPILSVLGLLNDNFTGGDFIFWKDHKIKFKKGDILIFPSIFLYTHRVDPVNKGIRHSYISWVW